MTGGEAHWEMKRGGNKVSRYADVLAIRMRAYERTRASELMHIELASSANARLNDTPIQKPDNVRCQICSRVRSEDRTSVRREIDR
jgi:hypothetical protein